MPVKTTEKSKESGQTPSMLASLIVFGTMIGLILLSVILFPEEVNAGPLQISMTLATLFAVGVAWAVGGAVVGGVAGKYLDTQTFGAN